MAKYSSGWFGQSVRHSNARKYGKAGGKYSHMVTITATPKGFIQYNTLKLLPQPADSYFDKKQLEEGTKVEMEHTNDKETAKTIAKAHLKEDKDYYKKLAFMETQNLKKMVLITNYPKRKYGSGIKKGDEIVIVGKPMMIYNVGMKGKVVGRVKSGEYRHGVKVQLAYHKNGEYEIYHKDNVKKV